MLVYNAVCNKCEFKGLYYDAPQVVMWGCFACKKLIAQRIGELGFMQIENTQCYQAKHKLFKYFMEMTMRKSTDNPLLNCPSCRKKSLMLQLRKERYL